LREEGEVNEDYDERGDRLEKRTRVEALKRAPCFWEK